MKIEILSKPGCHLCDDAKAIVKRVQQKIAFEFTETDITSDPELEKKYGEQIPVLFINRKKAFKFLVTEEELLRKIKARVFI